MSIRKIVANLVYNPSSLINSSVVKTLTTDCSLKCGSFDQIGILSSNANAKKGISLSWEINLETLDNEDCEGLFNSIIFENLQSLDHKRAENPSLQSAVELGF